MRLPNPWVILGVLLALAGLYRYGYHKGWVARDVEMQLVIAQKNEEARAKEQAMAKTMSEMNAQLKESNHAIDQKQSALDRAIRAGRVRLPAASCVQATPNSPTPSGDRDEAPSESDRQTLAAIASIVADGDRATVQLNACIDAYEKVMEQVNGNR